VDGNVCAAIENCVLNLAREDTEAAKIPQSLGLIAIARRADVHQFHSHVGGRPADQIGNMIGLPQRQITGPSGNSNGLQWHLTTSFCSTCLKDSTFVIRFEGE
jgi:hypothetical protein